MRTLVTPLWCSRLYLKRNHNIWGHVCGLQARVVAGQDEPTEFSVL